MHKTAGLRRKMCSLVFYIRTGFFKTLLHLLVTLHMPKCAMSFRRKISFQNYLIQRKLYNFSSFRYLLTLESTMQSIGSPKNCLVVMMTAKVTIILNEAL